MGLGAIAGLIAGATAFDDRGGLWTAAVEVNEFSEGEKFFDFLEVFVLEPVPITSEFTSGTGGVEGNLLSSDESGVESRTRSVSEKKLLFTGFIGSIQYKYSSEVIWSQLSILKHSKLF